MKIKKPRSSYFVICSKSIGGNGPFIWISSQGSSTPVSPNEAERVGKKLIQAAKYVRSKGR